MSAPTRLRERNHHQIVQIEQKLWSLAHDVCRARAYRQGMPSRSPSPIPCPMCGMPAAQVYTLPPRVAERLPMVRPACYFCFLRIAGIKPTRTRIAPVTDVADEIR